MPINLTPIVGHDEISGSAAAGTGVGTATGAAIEIRDAKGGPRDNRGRTISIRVVGYSLNTGTISLLGRVNPVDDTGWAPLFDLLTGAVVTSKAVVNGSVVVVVLGADYREMRVDSSVASGTMDLIVAMGT